MLPLPSSSSSGSSQRYEVFLSFRGADTRKSFTDHLHAELKRKEIVTFRDDQLEPGNELESELFNAIRESWCSIIIFSERYASSRWCLDELAEIVEQRNKRGHEIFPIFYKVEPSDLRYQKGKVQEVFTKHEERYKDKVERWRKALEVVTNLTGWPLSERYESELIGEIVQKISAKLCQTYPIDLSKLIGIDSRLKELHSKLNMGKDDVRIIGICGMGGIGKTTLAEVVFTHIAPHFEGKSFLANVREVSKKHGLVYLQKELLSHILLEKDFDIFNENFGKTIISHRLSHKKVLVVIDDADHIEHLECLVGMREWFGFGSRVIITTRNEDLLRSHLVDDVYKPTTLNAYEAFRLFSLKAFNNYIAPKNDFVELSKRVVKYVDGLPLALKVLGSFLRDKDVVLWRSAIERLERDSNKEIHDTLRISFDGLEEPDKNIFLDIACFFNGEEKDFVMDVLDGCGFNPDIGIDNLMKKSLLTIDEDNKLRMHDLLQEMGREIERQKSVNERGKRCRLWKEDDVRHVLTNNTATEAIEGMLIGSKGEHRDTIIDIGDIALEMIAIDYMRLPNCYKEPRERFTFSDALLKMKKLRLLLVLDPPYSCGDVKYLSNELRLFEWHRYRFKSLPSNFQPDNLVALLLPNSHVEQIWKANRPLYKLKFVNLKGSQNLIKTPDFAMTPNLESLILEDCTGIVKVHPSIGDLRKLKLLSLKGCRSLRSLHTKIGLESLEKLILSGCSNLQSFPEIDGLMKCLRELYLDGTGIEELPSSIGHLNNLVLLNLKDCRHLVRLPNSIDGCVSLKNLNLSGCSKLETLPINLQQVEILEELDLKGTAIRKPPSFIFQFKNLKVLSFSGCEGPDGSTKSTALVLPPLLGLRSLTKLSLSHCNLWEETIPADIFCLSSLKELDLGGNNFICLPATLNQLSRLRLLVLSDCKQLKSVPELLTSIEYVSIAGCTALEVFANPKPVDDSSIDCPYLNAINCYRLSKNSYALTMLKSFIKVFASTPSFCILIPGSQIPEWFNFQSDESSMNIPLSLNIGDPGSQIPEWFSFQRDESSIKIPLPPNIRNDSQWLGVAFCCVFVSTFTGGRVYGSDEMMSKVVIHGRTVNFSGFSFGREYRRPLITEEHHWLRYWSRDKLYPFFLENECGETQNFLSINIKRNGCFKVKKCGVRIVYEKDLKEIEQMKEQCSTSASASSDDHSDAFVNSKGNIDDEEAARRGCDSFEETPQPKCLGRITNFIMRKKH